MRDGTAPRPGDDALEFRPPVPATITEPGVICLLLSSLILFCLTREALSASIRR